MDISETQLSSSIQSHSILIYDPKTDGNGSGVLVELEKRVFVLTAAHVVKEENVLISMGLPGQQEPFSVVNRWSDSDLDIGYLELNPFEVQLRRGDNIRSYKISTQKRQQAPAGETFFILCGFPFSEIIRNENVRKPTPVLIWSALMHPTKWSQFLISQGKTPENNFVVLYGGKHGRSLDQTGIDVTPFPPGGLSGCGLWYFDPSTAFSNNPFYSLAGIQTSFVKAEQVLVGTFSDKIIDRILLHYGMKLES